MNLEKHGIPYHECETIQMEEFAMNLSKMNGERNWNFHFATCREQIDIDRYGVFIIGVLMEI